jgi:hypothetical protein
MPVRPQGYEICMSQLTLGGVPPAAAMAQCAALYPDRAWEDPGLPPRIAGLWSFRGGLPGEVELRQGPGGIAVEGVIRFANGRVARMEGELRSERNPNGELTWFLRYGWASPDAGGQGYLAYDRMRGNVLAGDWEMHYPQRIVERWVLER